MSGGMEEAAKREKERKMRLKDFYWLAYNREMSSDDWVEKLRNNILIKISKTS